MAVEPNASVRVMNYLGGDIGQFPSSRHSGGKP